MRIREDWPLLGAMLVVALIAGAALLAGADSPPGQPPMAERAGAPESALAAPTATATYAPTASEAPAPPSGVIAVAGDGSVLVGLVDPDDPSIRHYEYQQRAAPPAPGWGAWMQVSGSSASTLWFRVSGLTNGTEYRFKVRAVSASGVAGPPGPDAAPWFVAATPVRPPPPTPTPTPEPQPDCTSGTAVPNPAANPELVGDCERLLAMRDVLAGTGSLDWSERAAIASWQGVTVEGSPMRVTRVELPRSGLTGQVSGLLGTLTGLTHLALTGNGLTGRLPSKVALLTRLTHVYIGGNAFTGCMPPSLREVANNDVSDLWPGNCPPPFDISYGEHTLVPGTYQFIWHEGDAPLIFDVPDGLTLRLSHLVLSDQAPGRPALRGLIAEDAATGRHRVGFDVRQGVVYGLWTDSADGQSTGPLAASPALTRLFDLLAESTWLGPSRCVD